MEVLEIKILLEIKIFPRLNRLLDIEKEKDIERTWNPINRKLPK